MLHRTLGETISVETLLGAGLWRVEADANQLESASIIHAVNARDAMIEGGKITIETANTHIDDAYVARHAELTAGQYVLLSVSDTGEGMDEDTQHRAFEPFFTTKPLGKGTGLGLSQVYGYVKQSGGHVKLYSERGLGTTVRIYLPRLLDGKAMDAPEETHDPVPDAVPHETILVVEDDEDVRVVNSHTLRELGYHVFEAGDGFAALALLRQEQRIDLLFTDVVLPGGMTGAQLAAQARGLRPRLRVLFTTGYARNAIVHQGRLDAGVHLLTKPFTHADLANKVRRLLDAPD
jgi:CheY-like chemotaxis protein